MPHARERANAESRLVGIDLPGVHVERRRHGLRAGLPERATHDPEREVPEITAPRSRHTGAGHCRRCERKLDQLTAGATNDVRHAGNAGIAIPAPAYREEAGIVAIAFVEERVERPFGSR